MHTGCPKNYRRFQKSIKEKQKAKEMHGLLHFAKIPREFILTKFQNWLKSSSTDGATD